MAAANSPGSSTPTHPDNPCGKPHALPREACAACVRVLNELVALRATHRPNTSRARGHYRLEASDAGRFRRRGRSGAGRAVSRPLAHRMWPAPREHRVFRKHTPSDLRSPDPKAVEALMVACHKFLESLARMPDVKTLDAAIRALGYADDLERDYGNAMSVAESVGGGPVKIGISAKPFERITSLESGSGRNLRLTALFPPLAHQLEHLILERYKAHAVRGEWLQRSDEVVQLVEACALLAPPSGAP